MPHVANYKDFLTSIQIVTKKMLAKVCTSQKLVCPNVPKKTTLWQDSININVITCIVLLSLDAVVWIITFRENL